jgi:hypothetical protein
VQSSCNILIEVFHDSRREFSIYSVQDEPQGTWVYEESRWHESSVPALTPLLDSSETSLQLSENIILLAICRIYTGDISLYTLYSVGDRTEPCGATVCIFLGLEISPPTEILNYLSGRNKLIILIKLVNNFNLDDLYSKRKCHFVSKVFSVPKNTAAVDMFLFKFKVTWSVSLIHWNVILWRARKTNWLVLSRILFSMYLWNIFRITLSSSLPALEKSLIWHQFLGKLTSYQFSVTLWLLLPSKILENWTAKHSDYTNVTKVPVIFLEGSWGVSFGMCCYCSIRPQFLPPFPLVKPVHNVKQIS